MGDEEAAKKVVKVDERPEFFWNYISKTLRLKQDKWQKLVGAPDFKVFFHSFFKLLRFYLYIILGYYGSISQ